MLKPSEKMLAKLAENDEPIDYSIDSIPLDFAIQSQYSDPDLEQLFSEDRARTLYIYKINNLVKTKQKPILNYSQNSVKIGFIDKDEYIKITGYEISDFNFKLQIQQNTTVQDNSTSYVMIDEKDILINDISKKDKKFLESYDLKIVSINEPITEDNKNECYIIEEYKRPYSPDGVDIIKSTHLVKITDFKWKNQNSIHLVLHKSLPEDTVFTGIEIKYPKSMLFGNIKCWGNVNGVYSYPQSIIQNANLVPLLSMPIETKPNVRIFQYWLGYSFLSWVIALNYIEEKDCLILTSIDDLPSNKQKKVFNNVRIASGKINFAGTSATFPSEAPKPNWPEGNQITIKDNDYVQVANYSLGIGIGTRDVAKWVSTIGNNNNNNGNVVLEFKQAPVKGNLADVLKKMLTYRYNYDRKFEGAKYDEKRNPINKIAELRQKFEGQKPENVIDGLFEEWKFRNPSYLNDRAVKRFKQIVYMLSNYVYSNMAVNKGYNDDIKLIAPYYFELVSISNESEKDYWIFEDCRVKFKSSYFNFSDLKNINIENIKLNNLKNINNNISENKVYQLETNFFNWLSITNELETNNIPSLIPAEIKLSDGEYGKYLTNLIISNNKLEICLEKLFDFHKESIIYSKSEWLNLINNFVENNIKILFSQNINFLSKIEISGIWGYGDYDITIFTEKEQININNLELFNKNNEKLSLVTIEM
ncbi:hypothetical protein [Spiroplasma endosymbiont of Seladonia tumulorum]|uniref:hypothetical protein n=1 Tax=Spiroplasma endosymbiont of Seladonia tumulorum TaxID=3066321 RepID=UPI0030CC4AB8